MTESLAKRIATLQERLVKLDMIASSADEASALEGLRAELAEAVELLAMPLEKQALLVGAKIAVAPSTALLGARKRASTLLERFRGNMKSATLKRGQTWKALLDEIEMASSELLSETTAAWRGYRTMVYSGDSPKAIKARGLARTTENDAAWEEYRALFARLNGLFESLPNDKAAIADAGKFATQLEETARKFNFDVPDDVKMFLEAVLSVDGAPLSLLTPAVKDWLTKEGILSSYRIRSTGQG